MSLLLTARDEHGAGLTDRELADELKTLLVGGYETTANTLAWALDLCARHPDARARALAEVDALGPDPDPDALAQLPYLGAMCQETVRLRPVLSVVGRQTVAPFTFAGHELPPGTVLGAAIYHLHHRPELYPDPERFDPERFLRRKYGPFKFIGSGGGARRCMGAAFATYLLRVSLGTVLAGYRWNCASSRPLAVVRRGVGFGPAGGARSSSTAPAHSRRRPGSAEPNPSPAPLVRAEQPHQLHTHTPFSQRNFSLPCSRARNRRGCCCMFLPSRWSIAAGDRVTHAKFGDGLVTAREGAGDSARVTVAFADATRTLLLRFIRRVD